MKQKIIAQKKKKVNDMLYCIIVINNRGTLNLHTTKNYKYVLKIKKLARQYCIITFTQPETLNFYFNNHTKFESN